MLLQHTVRKGLRLKDCFRTLLRPAARRRAGFTRSCSSGSEPVSKFFHTAVPCSVKHNWPSSCIDPRSARRACGVTLIEVIGVIAIIAILLTTSLPALRAARMSAWTVAEHANIRTHATAFASYTVDYENTWPFLTDPTATLTILRGGGVALPCRFFAVTVNWHIGMVDLYYDGNLKSRVFRSPILDGAGNIRPQTSGFPYVYSSCFISSPKFWNKLTRTGPDQWRSVRNSEVRFPSQKGLFLDVSGWYLPIAYQGDIPTYSVGFVDTHVRRLTERQLRRPYPRGEGDWPGSAWHSGVPVLHTIDGVDGRDTN